MAVHLCTGSGVVESNASKSDEQDPGQGAENFLSDPSTPQDQIVYDQRSDLPLSAARSGVPTCTWGIFPALPAGCESPLHIQPEIFRWTGQLVGKEPSGDRFRRELETEQLAQCR